MSEIKFRHGKPEKKYDDGWVIGWRPELKTTISVHPENQVEEDGHGRR